MGEGKKRPLGTKRIFQAVTLCVRILVWPTGTALAERHLVSGEPFPDFFKGSLIEAIGGLIKHPVTIEGTTIRIGPLTDSELRAIHPEALIGQQGVQDEAYPQLRLRFRFK